MKRYQHITEVAAPLQDVIDFFRNPCALKALTPFPIIVQFHMVQPMQEGSVVDFSLWFGVIPVRWVAVHHDIEPQIGFTDSMMRGPFEAWVHQHRFEKVNATRTRILDTVDAQPGSHPFWGAISKFMWWNLPTLFAYRGWRTRHALEKRRK